MYPSPTNPIAPSVCDTVVCTAPFEFFSSMVAMKSSLSMTFSQKNSRVPDALSRPTTTMSSASPFDSGPTHPDKTDAHKVKIARPTIALGSVFSLILCTI